MKYTVYPKGKQAYIRLAVIINILNFVILYLYCFHNENFNKVIAIAFAATIPIDNILMFWLGKPFAATVVFEENAVRCLSLGKVMRNIPYYEIKDYGTFWSNKDKFIY